MISEVEFRDEAKRWLNQHAEPRPGEAFEWGQGTDRVGLFVEQQPEEDVALLAEAKAWRAMLFDAGFGWIGGPPQYGGRGLPPSYQAVWDGVEAGFAVPSQSPFGVSLGMVAPTLLAHGSERVRDGYLRPMFRGDFVGCQLFSEPGAGSDLAGAQTSAVRDGAGWVLNGQKVWTSGAHYSDVGEILCRSDPNLPKHRGLTAFAVDMHARGVEVRPLRQMTGGAAFNEVFLTDVRVPDDHRLGDVNQGWTVALTTLMNERAAIGGGLAGRTGVVATRRLVELIRHADRTDDPVLRQRLADVHIHGTVARLTGQRLAAAVKDGELPGAEMSMGKLALTNNLQRVCALLSMVLGPRLVADPGEWGTYAWAELVLGVPGFRVGGGTDEVMRNVLAERVLGLPKN